MERAKCRNLFESIDNVIGILEDYGFVDERVGAFFGLISASKDAPSFGEISSGRGTVKKPIAPLPMASMDWREETPTAPQSVDELPSPPPPVAFTAEAPMPTEELPASSTAEKPAVPVTQESGTGQMPAVTDVPAPKKLEEFIGQEHIVSRLKEEIEVARILGKKHLDNIMLKGNRGLGKSTLARLASEELGVRYEYVDCTSFMNDVRSQRIFHEFIQRIANANEPVAIVFDEIHTLPVRLQSNLLTMLNDRVYSYLTESGTKHLQMPEFTFIAATTDYDAVLSTLKDRCSNLTFMMKDYTRDELYRIFLSKLRGMGLTANEEVIRLCINRCRSSIRDVTAIIKGLYSKAVLAKTTVITQAMVEEYFLRAGVDAIGLKEIERRILQAVAEEPKGVISEETLAARVYLDPKVLTKEHEPFLMKIGFISINSRGRSLTPKAEDYLRYGYFEFPDGTIVGTKPEYDGGMRAREAALETLPSTAPEAEIASVSTIEEENA
ncbi:MAG: AAA family ATPase [Clostridia bacterium]|nr:AAA family ATPase [Clostridia bacterium]